MALVEQLFTGVDHPECVCVMPSGELCLGGELGQIYIGDVRTGEVSTRGVAAGQVLGVATDEVGNVYGCDTGSRAVVCVAPDGRLTVVTSGPANAPLVHPNSMAFQADGSFFVSDSGTWGADDGRVLAHGADGVTRLASREFRHFANGIALDPAGEYLYVAESRFGVSRAAVTDGALGPREPVLPMPGKVVDGLAFDARGGLLIACYQPNEVWHWTADGLLDLLVGDPTGVVLAMPTNVAFYGAELRNLAVATLGSRTISTIALDFAGAPVALGAPARPVGNQP